MSIHKVVFALFMVLMVIGSEAFENTTESSADDRGATINFEDTTTEIPLDMLGIRTGELTIPIHARSVVMTSQQCAAKLTELESLSDQIRAAAPLEGYVCKTNGVVMLTVQGRPKLFVCDYRFSQGSLVIMRREDPDHSLSFHRGWDQYVNGFGDFTSDFWLGLDRIAAITSSGHYKLNIQMVDLNEDKTEVTYEDFFITGPEEDYRLVSLGNGIGAKESEAFQGQVGMKFSTKDIDNDLLDVPSDSYNIEEGSCASKHKGGWWYAGCGDALLTALYSESTGQGIRWKKDGVMTQMKSVKMVLRPVLAANDIPF